MKLVLITILGMCFLLLGMGIRGYYSKRYDFYKCFARFISILANQITFLKSDIYSIVQANTFGGGVDELLADYMERKTVNVKYLSEEENASIKQFLDSVGHSDVDGELANIEYYNNTFSGESDKAKEMMNSKGNMYFKLSALVGVMVCIIFL